MPTYAVTSQASFAARKQRDTALSLVQSEATNRGWVAAAHHGLSAGAAAVGTTGMTISYTAPSESTAAEAVIFGHLHANALDGAWLSITWLAG